MSSPPAPLTPFDQKLNALVFRSVSQLVNHPLEYGKVLIQLGYEPFPPRPGRFLLFGRSVLYYPNAFQYVKYLKSVDGLPGLYRGLAPRLLGSGLHYLVSTNLIELSPIVKDYQEEEGDPPPAAKKALHPLFLASSPSAYLLKQTCWEVGCVSAAVTASHPLQVITIKMMAAFVGREFGNYGSLLSTLCTIIEEEGIRGLFAGLLPRVLAESLYVVIASVIVHLLKYSFERERVPHYLAGFVGGYTASTLTYQLHLVSNNMIVNGSPSLAVGNPPLTPLYKSSYEAWCSLRRSSSLSRGASLLGRTYTGRVLGGRAVEGVWGPVHGPAAKET